MPNDSAAPTAQSVWAVPAVAAVIGLAYLAAGLMSGDAWFGVGGLIVMLAMAGVLLALRKRSETVQGMLDRRDERINEMDLRATAFAGGALIVVVIGAFVVDIARGGDGQPYAWLGAVAGVAYVAAMVYNRVRS